jgi:hypothetical protein
MTNKSALSEVTSYGSAKRRQRRPLTEWQRRHRRRQAQLAVATALFLALVGLAMAIYLISVRGSANLHSENMR